MVATNELAFSYSGDPGSSDKDAVRFLVGDTNEADQLCRDSEILWAVAEESNVYSAAARVCMTIAARFAKMVDKEVGDLKIRWSQRQKHYLDLSAELADRGEVAALTGGGAVFAGGISKAQKNEQIDDTDRVAPFFRRGQDDNPNTVSATNVDRPLWDQ